MGLRCGGVLGRTWPSEPTDATDPSRPTRTVASGICHQLASSRSPVLTAQELSIDEHDITEIRRLATMTATDPSGGTQVDDQTSRTEITPPPASSGAPPAGSATTGASATDPATTGASATDQAPAPPAAPPPPPWRPPPNDSGRNASLVFGVIILLVGLWFFATHTLGLDLPRLDWDQLWPVALIVLGGLIVLNVVQHRAR